MKIEILIAQLQEIATKHPGIDVNGYDNQLAAYGDGEYSLVGVHLIDHNDGSPYITFEMQPEQPGPMTREDRTEQAAHDGRHGL